MMEFTISRVVICVCGITLLVVISGAVSSIYGSQEADADVHTAERLAYMLDAFEYSDLDAIVLEGIKILPEGYHMEVHNGFVELDNGKKVTLAMTSYVGEFDLDWNQTRVITRRRSLRSLSRCS